MARAPAIVEEGRSRAVAGRQQQIQRTFSRKELTLKYSRVTQTINNPADDVLFDRHCFVDTAALRCPVCGDVWSHAQAVYTLLGGDESEGLYRGSHLVARETPYRRDALAVRVHGETCGHRWDVVFQQQEGQTFVRVEVLNEETGKGQKERQR
jgi:hypothetical protein